MGYDDEAGRSRKRQNRGRQPVKRPGSRTPEYRKNKEPRYEENLYRGDRYNHNEKTKLGREENPPELSLITDSFKNDNRPGRSGRTTSGRTTSARTTSGRQSAATMQTGGGAYLTPEKKKAQKKRRKIAIILLEIVILLSVLLFAAYSYLNKSMNMMEKLPWDPDNIKNVEISAEKQEQMKGYWTIAVFGVDSRNSTVGAGNNADVNMICNINQDTGEIKLVSVFRDSYMNVSDKNSYNKINSAYLQGGPDQAVKALNKNLDLDIDDYVTFNWKAVADAINILGGVDLELSKAEFYYINAFVTETVKATGVPSEPVKHAGMVHLDGVQAVAYGRLRLMDTDYARTERQRKIISLAFDKLKVADWATVNNVIQTIFPQISTSVTLPEVLSMGRDITKLHMGESAGFPMARSDADMGPKKGACVIPQTLESNVRELHKFMFGDDNYEPTNTVKTISKKIISDTGLAKEKKPVDHVDTDGGSIPKSTTKEESKPKESTVDSHESSDAYQSGEDIGETKTQKPTYETDSIGNLLKPIPKESEGQTTKPGTGKPGTTQQETTEAETTRPGTTKPGTVKPGATEAVRPTEPETITPRPGSGSGNTDTGVILGPGISNGGNNQAPGSGGSGNNNAPGSGGSNNQIPGSGQVDFNGPS